jgi:hypothetical protein
MQLATCKFHWKLQVPESFMHISTELLFRCEIKEAPHLIHILSPLPALSGNYRSNGNQVPKPSTSH